MSRQRKVAVGVVGALVVSAALLLWQPWTLKLEVGGVRINPYAKVNPERTYKLVVWDYELPLPWSQTTHRQALEESVRAFTAANPHIRVELVVRPWDEGDGPVRDALENGNPPDVLGMPHGVRLLAPEYQIPLEHYLTDSEQADLFASARHGASARSHLWAMPRRIDVARWVVRADRWPDRFLSGDEEAQQPPAPTLAAWTEALAAARTSAGRSGLAANLLDPAFFSDLMMAVTGRPFLNNEAQVQWSEESIRTVAATLRSWAEKGLLATDVETAARTRLGRFWSGGAVAIAPVNTWLLHHLLQRSGALTAPDGDPANPVSTTEQPARVEKRHRSAVWTLPPQGGSRLAAPAVVSGYAVFRQASYKGHDHTSAAVQLAKHLSKQMGAWEAVRTFSVPAHPSAVPDWLASSRLPQGDLQALLNWGAAAVTPPVDDKAARLAQEILQEAVPNLVKVVRGELTPDQFAKELTATPLSAVAEVAVP